MSQVFSDNILYYNPISVFSNVAVLLLCEKGIQDQFEFKPLQMGIDNNAPWYIKLNPKGQVPTLIHLGKPIPDSLAIARHLDTCFGPTPVFSADDPNVLKVVEQWRQVRVLSLVAGKKSSTQDTTGIEANLNQSRQQLLKSMEEEPTLKEKYLVRLDVHDDRADLLLNHSTYLKHKAGLESLLCDTERTLKENDGCLVRNHSHTLADVYVTAILYWLMGKLDKDILKDKPALKDYYLKQTARPSFAKAFFN
ncbi:uncharacterized protein EV154DRAFT_532505 [Mucor mucedo]|uniref:uncharacterized protein n=1 Tax=Mucor mucedo TaxID=29922 RepID=UPI00221F3673|nr:uncharacterized protein EV154DRAFT_532505 [Mucor mucedo]KAI7866686.1 hypothetical protein EV154DRAFT_532505 [Mucor mucedo]